MSKTNIAIVCTPLLGLGGVANHIAHWAMNIDESRFRFFLFYFSKKKELVQEHFNKIPNIEPIYVSQLSSTSSSFYVSAISKLKTLFQINNIAIVHTMSVQGDIIGGVAAKWANIPILISSLESMVLIPEGTNYFKLLLYSIAYNKVARNFDQFIAISNKTKTNLCANHPVNPDKVTVIHNGVDLTKYRALLAHEQVDNLRTKARIGTVSRFTAEKALSYFINAIPLVLDKFPIAEFFIAGDGPERARLENLVEYLELRSKVKFLGWIDNVPKFLDGIDIFVLHSFREGIPWAILEALAAAKPVVAPDVGGCPEVIIDGLNGLLIQPGAPHAIANAIIAFLENPEKAANMGRAGRKTIENNFTQEIEIKQLESLYYRLLKKKLH